MNTLEFLISFFMLVLKLNHNFQSYDTANFTCFRFFSWKIAEKFFSQGRNNAIFVNAFLEIWISSEFLIAWKAFQ